ncbi:hypothetical protein RHMOL_Rhmol09G0238300 [Rhododendron molle]|uniref:Uncharacterized protein n=1 Tax=Rhododendron molle TaxID=49168 RepID=A0ACC0MGG1_RHOML|nr:hypothetical protein RHMOL_Rhmol09G0238300 [Rhododendron molle]
MSGYGHFPAKPMQKKVDVVVEGVTYCQSCDYYEIPSHQEPSAALIAAAEVNIICKKSRSQNRLASIARLSKWKQFTSSLPCTT